jgi:uncharacterized SAM-binding protein YcdF (DUF218 family)
MFVLKQFLKGLLLPPTPWLLLLFGVLVFWRRRWARTLLAMTLLLVLALHSGPVNYVLRYPLESRYPALIDPTTAAPYDAIVVLTGGTIAATGLIPFPSVDQTMSRRLEEAWRLYRIRPAPIVVSGGHVNPFTPAMGENRIARDTLIRWGVPEDHVIGEEQSRDTFESAVQTANVLRTRGWTRYALVTSALHMPRSMLVFSTLLPEPIAAPGDFSVGAFELTPLHVFPSEDAAQRVFATIYEYVGLANYHWRLRFSRTPSRP